MKRPSGYGFAVLSIMFAALIMASGCVAQAPGPGAANTNTNINTNTNVSAAVPVEVTGAAQTGSPDLVITAVSLQSCEIYYTIKNIGAADAGPTTTTLHVNGIMPASGGTAYVPALPTGQQMALAFSNYQWPWCTGGIPVGTALTDLTPSGSGPLAYVDPAMNQVTVQACANGVNPIAESDSTNNCFTTVLGLLVNYDMIPVAHLAQWINGTADVIDQGAEDRVDGSYIENDSAGTLEMIPNQVPQGWIQGTWGVFYSDPVWHSPQIAAIKIPANMHFKATIGLSPTASGGDGVKFMVGLKDLTDQVNWFPAKTMTVPGQMQDWDIDLSSYQGQIYRIVLKVQAVNSPAQEYAVWSQARLIQVNP